MEEGDKKKIKNGGFQSMGLEKLLLQGVFRMGYKIPTPIQRKGLPIVLSGMDIVCMARTGSGKTCVFLLPMIQKLVSHQVGGGVRGLLLAPTRELAMQTFKFAKDMAHFTDLRIVAIVGGDPLEAQFEALSNRPDIIVATPGRLVHHLKEISTFKLKHVQYLVFDEADRLFEMGFSEQLTEIVRACPTERQTLLFSATLPRQILQFARAGLREPQFVNLETDVKLSDELRAGFFHIRSNEKIAALLYLVNKIILPSSDFSSSSSSPPLTIIFTATRHHSEFIHALFKHLSLSSALIYGTMDQEARQSNLKSFRNGEVQFLIVTDLAARGIDIPHLNFVINFSFPPSPKLFIHRCGRAGRAGRIGYAFSLVEPDELSYCCDVHLFLEKEVTCGIGGGKEDKILLSFKKNKDLKEKTKDDEDANEEEEFEDGEEVEGEDEEEEDGKSQQKSKKELKLVPSTTTSSTSPSSSSSSSTSTSSSSLLSYTLDSMTPSHVHCGLIPQDILDEGNEYLKHLLSIHEDLANTFKVSENGMKQYKRTRPEASKDGLKMSRNILKNDLIRYYHPLIVGTNPEKCGEKAVEKIDFIRMLQTFRPSQTIFETGIGTGGGIGGGSGSNGGKGKNGKHGANLMKNFSSSTSLVTGEKRRTESSQGVKMMNELRKVTSSLLERNKSNHLKKMAELSQLVLRDTGLYQNNNEDDEEEENEEEEGGEVSGKKNKQKKMKKRSVNDEDDDDEEEEDEEEEEWVQKQDEFEFEDDDEDDDDEEERDEEVKGKGKGKKDQPLNSTQTKLQQKQQKTASSFSLIQQQTQTKEIKEKGETTNPQTNNNNKLRLNAAEKRKLKKIQSKQLDQHIDSENHNKDNKTNLQELKEKILSNKQEQMNNKKKSVTKLNTQGFDIVIHNNNNDDDDDHDDDDDYNRSKKTSSSSSSSSSSTPSSSSSSSNTSYQDPRFFMSYGETVDDEKKNFIEFSLQPNSSLRSVESRQASLIDKVMIQRGIGGGVSGKGGGSSGGGMMTLDGDEESDLNRELSELKKKRVMRWDAKKRKFVKQSFEEISKLKGVKRDRANTGGGGGLGSGGKDGRTPGELYEKWRKKTRREVSLMGTGSQEDVGEDNRPRPNVQYNSHVKSELKDADTIRKNKQTKDNLKLKNMSKDKRRVIEGKQRKSKQEAQRKTQGYGSGNGKGSGSGLFHKAANKKLFAIPTSSKGSKRRK